MFIHFFAWCNTHEFIKSTGLSESNKKIPRQVRDDVLVRTLNAHLTSSLSTTGRSACEFTLDVVVLPEKAVYARLCDLINIQHEACLKAQIAFARSAGIEYVEPGEIVAKVRKNGDKSQLLKLKATMLEARKSRPISFSQLQECGVEDKEIRGAIEGKFRSTYSEFQVSNWLSGKVGSLKFENDKHAYIVKNVSKDVDSILVGRYTKLLVNDESLFWMDEDVDKIFRFQSGTGMLPSLPLNRQLFAVIFVLFFVAGFSCLISGYNLVSKDT